MRIKPKVLALVMVGVAVAGITAYFVARQLAYARVEQLTESYAHEFTRVLEETETQGCESIAYYKVFNYSSDEAKLFVVYRLKDRRHPNHHGVYVYLRRTAGEWEITDYELVWAQYGSADGITWPPYD